MNNDNGMLKPRNNRFKNYGLWVAIAAMIGMVLQDAGVSITPEKYQSYVDIVLTIAIFAGVINNPANGKGFKDKQKLPK